MKAILTFGTLGATVNAGLFADLHAKNQRIINNPFNQKLFAELETTKVETTTSKTDMASTSNLRKLANRVKGKNKMGVVEGFANPDCSGPLTMYFGIHINNCFDGVNSDGHGISKMVVINDTPFAVNEVVFTDNYQCNVDGDNTETEDMLAELPFDESYTIGTCAVGTGMKAHVIDADDIRKDLHGILFTEANSPDKCDRDDYFEFNHIVDGLCYEEDGISMMYSSNGCVDGLFTKTSYTDSECNNVDNTITAGGDFETCRLQYDHFQDFQYGEKYVIYDFMSLRCVLPNP